MKWQRLPKQVVVAFKEDPNKSVEIHHHPGTRDRERWGRSLCSPREIHHAASPSLPSLLTSRHRCSVTFHRQIKAQKALLLGPKPYLGQTKAIGAALAEAFGSQPDQTTPTVQPVPWHPCSSQHRGPSQDPSSPLV